MPLRTRCSLSSPVFICAPMKWEEVLGIPFLLFFLEQKWNFVLAFSVPYINDLLKK